MLLQRGPVIGQYVAAGQTDAYARTDLPDPEWAWTAINLLADPIMVTDAKGRIMLVNDSYARVRGMNKEQIERRDVKELSPSSKVYEVLETRKAVSALSKREDGTEYMVEIVPIFRETVLVGTIMMAKSMGVLDQALPAEPHGFASPEDSLVQIIGSSQCMLMLKEQAKAVATSDLPVLILGETGTGKEMFAKAIHHCSGRNRGPFTAINCSSFPEGLIDSELFGYDGGAFTGARRTGKLGLVEAADSGTLFLDEIGDMPTGLQSRLLRVIEDGVVRRIGSTEDRKTNFRLIAATNRHLETLVGEGVFRSDLFYRLKAVTLTLPPLRQRGRDVAELVSYFVSQAELNGSLKYRVAPSALSCLCDYSWPGNVRELRNTVLALCHLSPGGVIRKANLPEAVRTAIPAEGKVAGRRAITIKHIGSAGFITNREYCRLNKVERSTAFRDLNQFVAEGLLEALGQGRARRYRLVSSNDKNLH